MGSRKVGLYKVGDIGVFWMFGESFSEEGAKMRKVDFTESMVG